MTHDKHQRRIGSHVALWLADALLRRHRVSTQPSNVVPLREYDMEGKPAVPFPTGEPGHVYDRNDPRLGHGADEHPVKQRDVYLILTPEERAAGFIRPVRRTYRHVGRTVLNVETGLSYKDYACGGVTTMSLPLAETYAAKPGFYGSTYCCSCKMHRPVQEFVWEPDRTMVGS